MMPHAIEIIKYLKTKYKIAIMSDSDGSKQIKLERIRTLGVENLFDAIVTSDDINQNKPNKKFYDKIFKKFDVAPEDCMMFGDKPEVDLQLAKKLGMETVWVIHGNWAADLKNNTFDYIDHKVENLRQLREFL